MAVILSFISFAALFVKVTASISCGLAAEVLINQAILYVRVLVFPLPAPAKISIGLSLLKTASFCLSLSDKSKFKSKVILFVKYSNEFLAILCRYAFLSFGKLAGKLEVSFFLAQLTLYAASSFIWSRFF